MTGATGFVGRALVRRLRAAGMAVLGLSRRPDPRLSDVPLHLCDLGREPIPATALSGAEGVVHLAGHAHTAEPRGEAERAGIRTVNVEGTRVLARAAAEAGVRRFVFLSSAVVHGPGPFAQPIDERAPLAAANTYAASKAEAEAVLWEIAGETGMEVCVLRPPLVYGAGAAGNFARLMAWARLGLPMPSAARKSKRSMIARGNLCDALVAALTHPEAAGETFLVADAEPLSAGDLYLLIREAMGEKALFLPCPAGPLGLALRLAGRRADAERLLGAYLLDASAIRDRLGWTPPLTARQEIEAAVAHGPWEPG